MLNNNHTNIRGGFPGRTGWLEQAAVTGGIGLKQVRLEDGYTVGRADLNKRAHRS